MPRTRGLRAGWLLGVALVLLGAGGQSKPDPLERMAPLLGRWAGSAEGQPGTGTVRRDYERVLRDRFIRVRNRSEYPAQAKNPKGEIHEDEAFISFDRARNALVLRQFHVEGFVSQYVLDPSTTADRLVFSSEAIENIPPGFRARETYVIAGPDAFEEIFEMAEPGKPFEVYSRSRFSRIR